MTFIDFSPNPNPQIGYKIGIGWCVWLGFEMIAAGFEDQSKAVDWVAKMEPRRETSYNICGND